jgi:cholesterol transport system auxiliary component
MKKIIAIISALSLGLITIASQGCLNLHSKSFEQKQYALHIDFPVKNKNVMKEKVIDIYYPEIAIQFSGSPFIYRTSDTNYTTDYYNVFFGSPAEQIHQIIITYLDRSNLFKYASASVLPAKADYVLKTYINAIYADYRDPKHPQAVINARFLLFDTKNETKIIWNKNLEERVFLSAKNSDAFVAALSGGMQKILFELTYNLRRFI